MERRSRKVVFVIIVITLLCIILCSGHTKILAWNAGYFSGVNCTSKVPVVIRSVYYESKLHNLLVNNEDL